MASLIDAVQRMRKIDEVTSQKDDVPPVYLMDELATQAHSSGEAAANIAEQLAKRITNTNPVVKYKALKVLKHLCNKGCTQFQRCMQKHAGVVREHVMYRGQPDPFKGDALNQRVRETAKEAIDILFSALPAANAGAGAHVQSRIQGFGSGSSSSNGPSGGGYGGGGGGYGSGGTGSGGGGGGSSKYVGFGSSSFTPASSSSAASGNGILGITTADVGQQVDKLFTEAGKAADVVTGLMKGAASVIKERLGGKDAAPSHQPFTFGRTDGSSFSDHGRPGYQDYGSGGSFGGGGGMGSSYSTTTAAGGGAAFAVGAGGGGGGRAGLGVTEQQLVDDICTPGGIRAAPDPEELKRFVNAVAGVDGIKVADALRAKMAAPSWQPSLRALCALEAILLGGSATQAGPCGEVAAMFQSDSSTVRKLLQHAQSSVKERAARVLRLLGEDVPVTAAPVAQAAAAQRPAAAAAPVPDMLSLDDPSPAPASTAASPAAAPAATAASVLDLLGDDISPPAPVAATAAVAPPAAAPAMPDLLGSLNAAAPAPPVPPSATLSPSFPSAAPPAPAPSASAAAPAVGGARAAPLDDLFSSLSTSETRPSGMAAPMAMVATLGAARPAMMPQQAAGAMGHSMLPGGFAQPGGGVGVAHPQMAAMMPQGTGSMMGALLQQQQQQAYGLAPQMPGSLAPLQTAMGGGMARPTMPPNGGGMMGGGGVMGLMVAGPAPVVAAGGMAGSLLGSLTTAGASSSSRPTAALGGPSWQGNLSSSNAFDFVKDELKPQK